MKAKNKRAWNFKDLIGKVFNRLTVLKFDKIIKQGRASHVYWICKCVCGTLVSISREHLISGNTRSCGCLASEFIIKQNKNRKTHGMTNTRFFRIWVYMKKRCLNPGDSNYSAYGGRGITVCDRWLKFKNFMEDMYESYLKHIKEFGEKNTSLDRIDVNGNYEPSNCEWTTIKRQNRNTRATSKTVNYDQHMYWRSRLASVLSTIVIRKYKSSPLLEPYLGCSIPEFKQHIESLFLLGMIWDNHGQGIGFWELDHIIGCNNFDLSKEEDRLKCFNYKNFQPMWWTDHKKKSTKRCSK